MVYQKIKPSSGDETGNNAIRLESSDSNHGHSHTYTFTNTCIDREAACYEIAVINLTVEYLPK